MDYNEHQLREQDTCRAVSLPTYLAVLLLVRVEEDVRVSVVELPVFVLGPVGHLQLGGRTGAVCVAEIESCVHAAIAGRFRDMQEGAPTRLLSRPRVSATEKRRVCARATALGAP